MKPRSRRNWTWISLGLLLAVPATILVARGIKNLATTRQAVTAYARLVAGANAQDLATIRSLCTRRYLAAHPPEPAEGGGVVGFPRRIHPNYAVWVQGPEVWLCQGNRVGLVVRFVPESGRWKYDGEVGLLRSDGTILPMMTPDSGSSNRKP